MCTYGDLLVKPKGALFNPVVFQEARGIPLFYILVLFVVFWTKQDPRHGIEKFRMILCLVSSGRHGRALDVCRNAYNKQH